MNIIHQNKYINKFNFCQPDDDVTERNILYKLKVNEKNENENVLYELKVCPWKEIAHQQIPPSQVCSYCNSVWAG